ncbi:MAG: hypothetical protein H6Q18_238 [Bacteroidetes bacterium]|nr:hypothetical protein [Bacteroidota bacterium]
MTPEEKIIKQIQMLGNGNQKTFLGVVENNYPDRDYIDVKDLSGTLYTEVRKRAAIGDGDDAKKGCVITPVNKSSVIISRIGSSDELFVEMFSEVESVVFDGGENEGLVKVKELTSKINVLENDINNLKTAFSTWVTVPSDGGAALKAITTTWAGSQLQITNKADIQNKKIKH